MKNTRSSELAALDQPIPYALGPVMPEELDQPMPYSLEAPVEFCKTFVVEEPHVTAAE